MGPAAGGVLRSFLVSLGFNVDQRGLRSFVEKSQVAAKYARDLGTTVTATMAAIAAATVKAASDIDDIGRASKRAGTSVYEMKALAAGIKSVGRDAGETMGIVENIGSIFRENLGEATKLRGLLGVTETDPAKATEQALDALSKMYKIGGANAALAQDIAGQYGISLSYLQDYAFNIDQIKASQKEWRDSAAALGVDYDKAAAAAAKVMAATRNTGSLFGAIKDTIFADVSESILPDIEDFAKYLMANKKDISEFLTNAIKFTVKLLKMLLTVTMAAGKAIAFVGKLLVALVEKFQPLWDGVSAVGEVLLSWIKHGEEVLSYFAGQWVPDMLRAIAKVLDKLNLTKASQWFRQWADDAAATVAGITGSDKKEGDKKTVPAGGVDASGRLIGESKRQQAMNFFLGQGLTPEHAAGIVANLEAESKLNEKAVGDGGKAYGVAQWHPNRQKDFEEAFGIDIRQSSFLDQLRFIMHEMENKEAEAGYALSQTRTAREAGSTFSRLYERPKNVAREARTRGQSAESIYRNYEKIPEAKEAPAKPGTFEHTITGPLKSVKNVVDKMPEFKKGIDEIAGVDVLAGPTRTIKNLIKGFRGEQIPESPPIKRNPPRKAQAKPSVKREDSKTGQRSGKTPEGQKKAQKKTPGMDALATSPVGSNLGSTKVVNINTKTEIHVTGTVEPEKAAKAVKKSTDRTNADIYRNTKGALR